MPGTSEHQDTGVPPTLRHVIGQRRAVEQLRTAIEANINDRAATPHGVEAPALSHILLTSSAGLGKTTLAQLVSREIGGRCHEALGQNIACASQLQGLCLLADSYDCLFIDEAHQMPASTQTALYRALEDRRLFVPTGLSGGGRSISIPPLTVILATTHEYCLLKPLRDRMKLVVRLERYSPEEMALLLAQRAKRLGWQADAAVIAGIAARSRGVPRLGIRLLEAARRTARAANASNITKAHLCRTCEIEGIDKLGLNPTEQQYLQILQQSQRPVRLNVIATMLGLPRPTIEHVVEADLIALGLITKVTNGRILTPQGAQYLDQQEEPY